MTSQTFHSKIDTGLMLYPALVCATVAGIFVYQGVWLVAILISLLLLFVWQLILTIRYKITPSCLTISAGFIYRQSIRLSDTKSIKPRRDIATAPAATTDRLEIMFGNNQRVQIAPKDKEAFIAACTALHPGLLVFPAS